MPLNFAEKVNDLWLKFIWNFKPDKVKHQTILPVDKRGLNTCMVNFTILDRSLKAALVTHTFMKLTVVSNAPSSPLFTAQYSNFDTSDFNLTSHVPSFYRDIQTVWQELHSMNPSTTMEYQHETIWNDCFIKIHGKPVFYSSWYRKGSLKFTIF